MDNYCKVLIVDDELIMRQGISHMIDWNNEGFDLIGQASNGEEALELIKENTPHIVITDVVMPKMDGVELIKILENTYPQIKIIVLSSYSDFDYVKTSFKYGAIDYILKPTLSIDELVKTLKRAAESIDGITLKEDEASASEDTILYNFITGNKTDYNIDNYQQYFKFDSFSLFGSDVKGLNYKIKTELKNDINNCLDSLSSQNIYAKEIKYNDELIIYLINSNSKNVLNLTKLLKEISINLHKKYSETSFIHSSSFISLKNLKDIFENNYMKLLQCAFYYRNDCFIDEKFNVNTAPAEKFNFNKFFQYTNNHEIDEALSMISEYLDNAFAKKNVSKLELKSLIQNCFYNIISSIDSTEENAAKLKSLKFRSFSVIEDSAYSDDLMINYNNICSELNKAVEYYDSSMNSHTIDKIIKYINEHYNENLSLTEVSNMFNFNYSYLSSYFGSHNKEGFNEFINKIRINKACEFLKKDISISNICAMVGYTDHSYFTKVFKKFTGMTPTSYRKQHFN